MDAVYSVLSQRLLGGVEPNIFFELALVLILAGVVAYFAYFLRQPSIVAYIIVGLIIGPLGFYHLRHGEIMEGLSTIGVTLLLFMVGLDLDISQLKRIGKSAVIAGIVQVALTGLIGLGLNLGLGLDVLPALYLAMALTFSSTIIVIKLLNEKKDLQSLYGKLAIGILLIQDVAAIFILVLISAFSGLGGGDLNSSTVITAILMTLAKAFMATMVVLWLSRYVFPKIVRTIDHSDELILLFSLGWSLGLAAFFSLPIVGFNPAIGGFVAGVALANTGVHHQISSRIKSIRDFFIIIFFIILGSQLALDNLGSAILPAIGLSLFVLVGKPLIIMVILSALGYKPRTSWLTGITLAQISEFSLILVALGLSSGHLVSDHASIITLVSIITIPLSSYGTLYADRLYQWLHRPLELFNWRKASAEHQFREHTMKHHIVLAGAHRLGSHILEAMGKDSDHVLVIDFDPDVSHKYARQGVPTICGDIADPHIQELANLSAARLIIATIPDVHDTQKLLVTVRSFKKHIRTIVAANNEDEAELLYQAGADYVLLPHFIGGLHLADIIKTDRSVAELKKLRHQHLKSLKYIIRTR